MRRGSDLVLLNLSCHLPICSPMGRWRTIAHLSGRPAVYGVLRLLAVMWLLVPLGAPAQAPNGADSSIVHGMVQDVGGHPVAAATGSLQTPAGNMRLAALTDSDGRYRFSEVSQGTYTLRATQTGFGEATFGPFVLGLGEVKKVDLLLREDKVSKAQAPLFGTPEFSDEPKFTVGGVTDATSLGGHGSDTVLRTKEALARDTVSLRDSPPRPPLPASSGAEKALCEAVERQP